MDDQHLLGTSFLVSRADSLFELKLKRVPINLISSLIFTVRHRMRELVNKSAKQNFHRQNLSWFLHFLVAWHAYVSRRLFTHHNGKDTDFDSTCETTCSIPTTIRDIAAAVIPPDGGSVLDRKVNVFIRRSGHAVAGSLLKVYNIAIRFLRIISSAMMVQ